MIPALVRAIGSLFFSWPVWSEQAINATAVSSFGVCICRWYTFGVNLASDLFAANLLDNACKIFPPTIHNIYWVFV